MRPEPRTNFLTVALSDHEIERVREAAAEARVEPADYLRRAALDAAFERGPELGELSRLVAERSAELNRRLE